MFLLGGIGMAFQHWYKPVGKPKKGRTGYPPILTSHPKVIVGLAWSGGGSRAAYLGAAILREIRRAEVRLALRDDAAGSGSLLEQLSIISSVSGGSLAAAYFVLNREELKADVAHDSWKRFLDKMALNYRARQWYMDAALNPIAWFKLLLSNFNRGHIARGVYDRVLYCGKTLSDLPDSPLLFINAVDVINVERYVLAKYGAARRFCLPEANPLHANDLERMCVDPNSVLVADAVFASSAFPFVYPQLPIRSFHCDHPSLHFLGDGGLLDNSGLLTLLSQMEEASFFSKHCALSLGIWIDAEKDTKTSALRKVPQCRDTAEDYAWTNTLMRQGMTALDVLTTRVQSSVLNHLIEEKLLWNVWKKGRFQSAQLESFTSYLQSPPKPPLRSSDEWINSQVHIKPWWRSNIHNGAPPMMQPSLVWLSLKEVPASLTRLLQDRKDDDALLLKFIQNAGLDAEVLRNEGTRSDSEDLLSASLTGIATDFTLSKEHRALLDLAGYVLTQAELIPAIDEWSKWANAKLAPQAEGQV